MLFRSINEIKVSSVSNNAEFAQVGDVTTTTKGGTNQVHGGLYWYHQNGAFDARDFFSRYINGNRDVFLRSTRK